MDEPWMRRALALAERGRGLVEPNPVVGAVVVRDGRLVGEGWHERYGEPHAEVNALRAAGVLARGATLYVTLEPCCHYGKTPPCTEAILRAGVRRVVAAMNDPFPQVSSQGMQRLRAAGLEVVTGLCETEARRVNAPYLTLLRHKRPYVHLKWAMTLDGKIASRTGDSRWISNEECRRRVHELRGRMDAILVGIGTVLADDPLLTARPAGPRTACRVVLDSRLRIPPTAQLIGTAHEAPVLLVAGSEADEHDAERLSALGCEVLRLPTPQPVLSDLLVEFGRRRWTNLLVEGGAQVLGSFLDNGTVDEVHVFLAPRLLGGAAAKSPSAGVGVERIANAIALEAFTAEMIEDNVYLHGRQKR